jgi:hypothetical protein
VQLGRVNRRRVEEAFTVERMLDGIETAYGEAVGEKRAA